MLNQVVLVGRLTQKPEVEILENERKSCRIVLAVPRSYKNTEGEYETDFIDCQLWHGVAENASEYCRKGDIVGVKGRLEVIENKLIVIAEKITFLSSKKESEE